MNTRSLLVLTMLSVGVAATVLGFLLFQGVLSGFSFAIILAATLLLILAGVVMVRSPNKSAQSRAATIGLTASVLFVLLSLLIGAASLLPITFNSPPPTPTGPIGEPTPSPTPIPPTSTPVIIYVPVQVQAPSSNTSTIELVISLVSMTAGVGSTLTGVIVLAQSRRRK